MNLVWSSLSAASALALRERRRRRPVAFQTAGGGGGGGGGRSNLSVRTASNCQEHSRLPSPCAKPEWGSWEIVGRT